MGEISCLTATDQLHDDISVSIYPNPASNFITVQPNYPGLASLQVMDLLGNIRIIHSVSNQEKQIMDIHELENGVFFMLGLNSRGVVILEKMISKFN